MIRLERYLGLIIVLFGVAAVALAQPPGLISYQGRIVNSDGVPLASGSYDMDFIIYDAQSGGSAQHTEQHRGANAVTVSNGVFSVTLGQLTVFQTGLFQTNAELWLGVVLNPTGTAETFSRVRLVSTPFAIVAGHLAGVNATAAQLNELVGGGTTALHTHFGSGWAGAKVGASGLSVTNIDTAANASGIRGVGGAPETGISTAAPAGVRGESAAAVGVIGISDQDAGVYGTTSSSSPQKAGVFGEAASACGVIGKSPNARGVYGESNQADGVAGYSTGVTIADNGVYGETNSTDPTEGGVSGKSTNASCGVYGRNDGTGFGVRGYSVANHGVYGQTASASANDASVYGASSTVASAVYGRNTGTGANAGYGVRAYAVENNAIFARADGSVAAKNVAVQTYAANGIGLYAQNNNSSFYNIVASNSGLGNASFGLQVYGQAEFQNDVTFLGAKSGFVVDVAYNDDREALEAGDVVVISGAGEPVVGAIPVIKVHKTSCAADSAVVGVVYKLYDPGEKLTPEERAAGKATGRFVDGVAQIKPGQYLGIVTLGAFNGVKVEDAGDVKPGSVLTASGVSGKAAVAKAVVAQGVETFPQTAVIGKALGAPDKETGLVPVFVTIK